MMDGRHTHGGNGSAVVALAAVAGLVVVVPAVVAVIHALVIIAVGILAFLGLTGATFAVLVYKHGWPTMGGDTYGNRIDRATYSVVDSRRQKETPTLRASSEQDQRSIERRTRQAHQGIQARTPRRNQGGK